MQSSELSTLHISSLVQPPYEESFIRELAVIVELKSGESLPDEPVRSGANVSKTSNQVYRSYTVIQRGNGEKVLTNKGMFLTRYSEKEET